MKKKLAAVCMSLTVMASLCACGGGSSTASTTAAETTAAETTVEETSAEEEETAAEETVAEENAESAETEEAAGEAEETTAEETAAEEEAGIEEGDKGDGPADIDASLVTFTVPEGYSYEAYSYYIDEADPLFGDLQFDIYKTDSLTGLALVQVVATTQYYVHSQDEAVQKVIELCNLDTYKEGKANIGDDVTYGDVTYTKVDVTTEWSDQTFYVAYAENGNNGGVGLVVKYVVNNKEVAADDPVIGEVLESIKIVTK